MGAINYGTSPIITLGTPTEYMDAYQEEAEEIAAETGENVEEVIYRLMADNEDADAENAEYIIKNFYAEYLKLTRKSGYYQGNYIEIEDSRPDEYDDAEREQARRDVDELEKALLDLANVGYFETFPGWCMSFSNYDETAEAIKTAAWKLREEIEDAPRWTPDARTA